ncbi:hypothetical protein JAAARDRAFT_98958, partial [Jaapia argillacea MUCL 33604]
NHCGAVNSVAFSPDGRKLASASHGKIVRLWNTETGQSIGSALEGHTHWVKSVLFSPDGTVLGSWSGDGVWKYWNTSTGMEL